MKHAREDYQRIQDPAANPELLAAYNDAMTLVARWPAPAIGDPMPETRAAYATLSRLCRALTPTLGEIVTATDVKIPAHPIGADEPVFLLRGQDVYAPDTIRRWASLTYDKGRGNPDMARLASMFADEMEAWQVRTGRCKVADLPFQKREAVETRT